jgi:hypothetical protein
LPNGAIAATTTCPAGGTPPPGSTINGGLHVAGGFDGFCELKNVTVNGGITIDPTPDSMLSTGHWHGLDLIGSTVAGGVVVGDGSEIDANIDFGVNFSDFSVAPQHSTINGGVTFKDGGFAELVNTTVNGGLTITGNADYSVLCAALGVPAAFCSGGFAFCGNTINGNVSEKGVDGAQVFLGDPNEQFFANSDCRPNTIRGSLTLTDGTFQRTFDHEPSEIEGETITGSVILDNSVAEVNENTIGGSLLCKNGSVIHPPAAPDVAGNTVRGQDTCG